MENIEIYLDMDGVLANFEKSINEKKIHLEELEETIWNMVPELRGKPDIFMKQFFSGEQTDPVLKKAKKIYNVYRGKFYDIMGKPGFFLDLEPMPGYLSLVRSVSRLNGGKLPHILTAPVQTEHCSEEKKKWCDNHIGGLYDKFICQKNKTEYAEPFAILIDDLTKNTVPWDAAGGFAVLHTGDVNKTLRQVAEFIVEVQALDEA
jgi:5'(3')-deoxyribonucleotidase